MMRVQIGIGVVGVAIGMVGAYGSAVGVPGRDWSRVFTWLAGVVVAHDLLIAPTARIAGFGVFKILPYRFRPTMRVAALGVATVALIGVPLLMTR